MNRTGTIKLLVDAHVFDGEYQGTRTYLKELYSRLTNKDDLQLFLAAYDTDKLRSEFPHAGNTVFLQYRNRRSIPRLLFDIPALVKKYGIDYAHFQYISPLRKNCRFIVTTHDVLFDEQPAEFTFLYRKLKHVLYKKAAQQANLLTTVSEYSKGSIHRHLGIPGNSIHVIPHGVQPGYFAPCDKSVAADGIFRKYGVQNFILCVSRLEPRKNQDLLLRAYTDLQLQQQGYALVFIGHRSLAVPAFDELLQQAPPEIRQSVHWLDKVPDEDLASFYRAAAVFVYPSKAEGFGMPALEAAACRTPVLCSSATALADFGFFGANHVSPADYPVFRDRLAELTTNAQNPEISERIAHHIRGNYDWDKTANRFYELLKQDSLQ